MQTLDDVGVAAAGFVCLLLFVCFVCSFVVVAVVVVVVGCF